MFVAVSNKIQNTNKTHHGNSLHLCPVKFFIMYFFLCVLVLLLEMGCNSVAV